MKKVKSNIYVKKINLGIGVLLILFGLFIMEVMTEEIHLKEVDKEKYCYKSYYGNWTNSDYVWECDNHYILDAINLYLVGLYIIWIVGGFMFLGGIIYIFK